MMIKTFAGILMALLIVPICLMADVTVHHDLLVTLDPDRQRIDATDTIAFTGKPPDDLYFTLDPNLTPQVRTAGVDITMIAQRDRKTTYRVVRPAGSGRPLVIAYSGRLYYGLGTADYARGIRQTRGLISNEGVYLAGESHWYPDFGDEWLTFSLQVEMPEGWQAITQGRRLRQSATTVLWRADKPQEQIYLSAGRLFEYTQPAEGNAVMVYLRQADPALAERYLSAGGAYLTMYNRLIGPYPYDKFALVENFWETGYGMPSFSLMGSPG